jgi:small redox-active disulfide protein 2
MKVEILGAGCANCHKLAAAAAAAVQGLGAESDVDLVKVEDMREIVTRGVMATPALAIDGEIVSTGRVLDQAEVSTLIATALAKRD